MVRDGMGRLKAGVKWVLGDFWREMEGWCGVFVKRADMEAIEESGLVFWSYGLVERERERRVVW